MRANVVVCIAMSAFLGSLGVAALRADKDRAARRADQEPAVPQADQDESAAGAEAKRIQIGFAYVQQQGIKLDLRRKNWKLVGLGSYLVNGVGGCNDCHTAPPYTKDPYEFLGAPKQVNLACYLAGGQEFGPFVSRDITPWEDEKPAGLTLKEFMHVIRTGEDPDHPGQLLQVMPWPVYQIMTDRDLRAMYEYLSAIPPIVANTCGTPSE